MSKLNFIKSLTYSDIFGGLPDGDFLSDYNTNQVLDKLDMLINQPFLIYKHKEYDSKRIFIHSSTLEIVTNLISQNNLPEVEVNDSTLIDKIVKEFLVANEKRLEKNYSSIARIIGEKKPDTKLWAALITSIFDTDFINQDIKSRFYAQIIKANLLLDFLQNDDQFKKFYTLILSHFGQENHRTIFETLIHTGILIANDTTSNFPKFNIEDVPHFKDIFEKYSTIPTENASDFKQIRDKPILKISDGEFRVLSRELFTDKLFKVWYFLLNAFNKQKKVISSDFRGEYTKKFSEEYLSKEILRSCFDDGKRKFITEKEIGTQNGLAPSDFYIIDWKNIFIFEVKDTLLVEKNRLKYDFDKLENDLREKLCSENEKGTDRKGVMQLVNSIKEALDKKYDFLENKAIEKYNIYPILLVNDEIFNAAGLNYLINKWYQTELQQKGIKNPRRIKPLTVITIDTLIINKKLFKTKKLKLKQILDQYATKNLKIIDDEKLELQKLMPVSKFILDYVNDNKINNEMDDIEYEVASILN